MKYNVVLPVVQSYDDLAIKNRSWPTQGSAFIQTMQMLHAKFQDR